ncbi:MAG: recombinase family protein [Marinisporobacter sp.]|jgi:DNA invertase Pin-like site-specific DNA recombinase|nr:recombinase family protein [Marinisporobacter sp.]MCV6599657.1 recombinase family protein [Alphaproteobacteria bacterium]
MKLGYARVSTRDQCLNRQLDILKDYGCEKIWQEKISGQEKLRPELENLLKYARQGDIIVVNSISRLARSLRDLLSIVDQLKEAKVDLVSLQEQWLDTTTAQGQLLLTIFGGLSEFERNLISERTRDGLKSARARGRVGGRPKVNDEKIERALMLYDLKALGVMDICRMTGISKTTLYKYLKIRKFESQNRRK